MKGFWHGQAMRRLAVYCGSRSGHAPEHGQAATALGRAMARRGVGLVYGAAQIGLMGTIADAVLAADGEVIGVIPEALMDAEVAHHQLTRLEVVADMHVRKARMIELADAMVALPGGLGGGRNHNCPSCRKDPARQESWNKRTHSAKAIRSGL